MTRGKARTIDLETYEEFLENRQQQYITHDKLNQIIYMHGFGKLHRKRKGELMSTITTMDLLIPLRSTLEERESVSSYASLTIEQVKEDLEILGWEECPVRSVETVKLPWEEVKSRYQQLKPTRFARAKRMLEMEMVFGNMMRKPRSKRKRRNLLMKPTVTGAAAAAAPPSFATLSSPQLLPWLTPDNTCGIHSLDSFFVS